MNCERNILEFSLSELSARRKLKDSQKTDVEAEDTEIIKRRPYLNKCERDLTKELPETVLKEYFKPGEFVHVPMTQEERSLVEQFKKFIKKKGFEEFSEEDWKILTE